MIRSNFHTHTTFCDGKHTPEEVVREAIALGMETLGFSGHAHAGFDEHFSVDKSVPYRAEILRLRDVYADKIQIMLGVEEDFYTPVPREDYEYIIGSLHYYKAGDTYYPLDSDYKTLSTCITREFGGDPCAFATAYYEIYCDYIERRKPDIVAHFDLITKFDEKNPPLFLGNPEYEKLAVEYARRAAKSGCLFEVNTGAISRGYRTTPYPSISILHALKECGARMVLSSDSHSKDTLLFEFDLAKEILRDVGFTTVYTLAPSGISEHRI